VFDEEWLMTDTYATKGDFAYALVRNKILTNEYGPGTALNQAVLARDLGISTTPLREALRRLKSEGLVELDAHRDARVTGLSAEEARDLLEMRRALDPMAAALAAERRARSDITEIRTAFAKLKPLPDEPEVADLVAHREFHRAIYIASHNELLITTLDGLWDKADRYRLLGLQDRRDTAERAETEAGHRALFEAVLSGDSQLATKVMRDHIRSSLGAKALARLSEGPPG
jgi:DNA-binding GntR family transcriptional regulator